MINVLAIDDDQETLDTIRLYLSDHMNVTCVSSGRQALLQVRQQRYDIILLDIEMPVMNGFLTLERLRKIEECVNIPIVMLTGKQDRQYVMNSIVLGIDGYLLKPVSKKDLLDKIQDICQKKHRHSDTKTILAIDDDMSYLKQLNGFLKDYYNVIMINTTRLALDYLTNYVPDLILLDYQMPLYNGVALLNMIRQNDKLDHTPVIVLSGNLNEQVLVEFYPYNPAACLSKTISKDMLLEKIATTLDQVSKEEI